MFLPKAEEMAIRARKTRGTQLIFAYGRTYAHIGTKLWLWFLSKVFEACQRRDKNYKSSLFTIFACALSFEDVDKQRGDLGKVFGFYSVRIS